MAVNANPAPAAGIGEVRGFLLQAVFWNLALFVALRTSWAEQHVIAALVDLQTSLLAWYGAKPAGPVVVTSACSGADVMALCAGIALAYPVEWARRLRGAAVGLLLILALNAVRIASLYAVGDRYETLQLLHVWVWPTVLILAVAAYLFVWMRGAERAPAGVWPRFLGAAIGGLVLYAIVAPFALQGRFLLQLGTWAASLGGGMMSALGAAVTVKGNILVTARGAYQVTQDCMLTPVLPVYLAALLTLQLRPWVRVAGLLAAPPLFFGLGVARLLALAAPAYVVQAPATLTHGFYQILLGGLAIVLAARQSATASGSISRHMALGIGGAGAFFVLASGVWQQGVTWLTGAVATALSLAAGSPAAHDSQGALAMLLIFQPTLLIGLYSALSPRRSFRALLSALAVLLLAQLALMTTAVWLDAEWQRVPVLLVRLWALLAPVALAATWVGVEGTTRGDRGYLRFWHGVGDAFPDLGGAVSTAYYRECEERLLREGMGNLAGMRLLKTDLWDEAKNTRILQWAADQGAQAYGVDISPPIVREARHGFGFRRLRAAVSDVRALPFASESLQGIYSMGTVEHFSGTEDAVRELARVLAPGGRIILGVPNRLDPFLRPLLVAVLYRLGLYDYGFEKSYTRGQLRRMLEAAGLRVEQESGLLFVPGWLRMLDLWCHTRAPALAWLTGAAVRPFMWLDRAVPAVRRHGYLLATTAVKPAIAAGGGVEYVIDAQGCDPERLRSLPGLQALFAHVLAELRLRPMARPLWHVFGGEGGITGLVLLAESHLAIHTYPETGLATINLYCCRDGADWDWDRGLRLALRAQHVTVRQLQRGVPESPA